MRKYGHIYTTGLADRNTCFLLLYSRETMTLLAWIVIISSLFAAGWFARGLWDFINLIDEAHYDGRD